MLEGGPELMSNRIDQRIVEMSFENAKFEKGIQQSKSSLLDFTKALEKAGAIKDFATLENSINTIAHSLSAMSQIGIGALRRIGEAAVNTGMNVFKSLAIDPITQGFGEMELKMDSTQTIMASTGKSLEVVNEQLQELNEYSDKTIYSFSDMTANIGKFTNAGVELETSVAAIKGISNAAALAGANSNEASRAMYNFSQALSSGYVKLLDWKSIELANMATVEFKQQLLDAGVAAGTLAKEANGMYKVLTEDGTGATFGDTISATKNFNDSLTNQWMTTKVLTTTLANYADETTDVGKRATMAATQVTTFSKLMATLKESVGSGWAQTFEIIFGDFNEARELWTGFNFALGGAISDISDARNALLSGGLTSGWKQFMSEGISDATTFGDTLTTVAKDYGIDVESMVKKTGSMEKAIHGNWLTGEMLTKTVTKMTSSIEKMSEEELANAGYSQKTRTELLRLRDALLAGTLSADEFAKKMSGLSGRENIIQGLKNSVVALLSALRPISRAFDQIFPPMTTRTLYQMTENFKDLTAKLIISEETAKKIQRTFAGVFAVFDIGWQAVKFLGEAFFEVVKVLMPVNGGLLGMTANFGDMLVVLDQIIKQSGIFQYGLLGVKIVALIVGGVISNTTKIFMAFVKTLLSAEHPIEYLGQVLSTVFTNMFKGLDTGFSWMTSKFFNSLTALQTFLNAKFSFGNNTIILDTLEGLKDFLSYITGGGADGVVTLSTALSSLDFSRIATFVTGGILLVFINQLTRLTKASGELVETTNSFVSKLSKKLFAPITKFKDLAFAVGVLTASLYVLSTIPFDRLKNGLAGLAGAMAIFTLSYAAMQAVTVIASKKLNGVEAMESALNLTAMAGGLIILSMAISKISKIETGTVWNSIGMLTAMMGVIVAYQAITVAISLIPGTRAANIGMGLMASGLLGLVTLVLLMDKISPEMIAQSLSKMTGAMLMLAGIQAVFALAARASGGSKVAVNVLGISMGILAMIGVSKLIALLDANEITQGAKNIFLLGGILAALQTMFSIASRINGGVKYKTNILSMQLGIASMAVLTAIVGRLDPLQLQNGIKNITKMAALIAIIELVTSFAAKIGGGHKLQKILGSVTMAMISFTALISILGHFKDETIDRGFVTLAKLSGLIMAIELMSAAIGTIKGSTRGMTMLIGMTITILTLTASLSLLSRIDQDALAQASKSLMNVIASVGVMGLGLGLMVKAFSGLSSNFSIFKGMVSTILPGFAALIIILGTTVMVLNTINTHQQMLQNMSLETIQKFAVGMGVISGLVIAFGLLAKLPGFGGSLTGLIPGFVAVSGVVLAAGLMFTVIGSVLPILDKVSPANFQKFTAGLVLIGGMVIGLALLTPIFALLGAGAKFAIIGVLAAIAATSLVVLSFAGLAVLMEALFSGNDDFLLRGIDKMIIIAEGIGRFVGAIVGGFSSEVLLGFGDGITKFASTVSAVKPEAFDGISSLAKAMLLLTGAALVDGIARFIGLGTNPGKIFGDNIKGMLDAFVLINPQSVTSFASVVRVLAPVMPAFSKLADAARDIPNTGGLLGGIVGDNNMDVFGANIRDMILAFSTVTTSDAVKVTSVIDALSPMMKNFGIFIDVVSDIPNSGGLAWILAGDNNIDQFATKIAGMITAFSPISVASAVKTATIVNALQPMMKNLGMFITTARSIPNSGGLVTLLTGGNDINNFAIQLKQFIDIVSTIDGNKLQGALSSLKQINESIKLVGSSAINNAINSLNTRKSDLSNNFTRIFTLVLNNSKQYIGQFNALGFNVVQGFQQGIVKGQKLAIKAADDMAKAVVVATTDRLDVHSPSRVFDEIGKWLPIGMANGIKRNTNTAILASVNMGDGVEAAIRDTLGVHSESKIFKDVGGWIPVSLQNGIESAKSALLENAKALGLDTSALTIQGVVDGMGDKNGMITTGVNTLIDLLTGKTTASMVSSAAEKMGANIGGSVGAGVSDGLDSTKSKTSKSAKAVVKNAFDVFKEAIDKKREYNLISVDEEIEAWRKFAASYKVGTEDRLKADKEYERLRFEHSKWWIDREKYYKRMSLQEELDAWVKVQGRYALGSEARIQADREIFRLKEEIWQAEYQHELDVIDDAKYYGKMKLDEELAAQKKIAEMVKDRAEEKKKSDREIFRLEKEINEANLSYEKQLTQVEKDRDDARLEASKEYYKQEADAIDKMTQDIDALRKSYESAVESRTKTLYSTYGLFDKVDYQSPVEGSALIKNLEDQNAVFENWQNNMFELTSKGVDAGLIKELQEMGPKSNAQIVALNNLTSVELTKYVSLWQKKSAEAKQQAVIELQAMKKSTEEEIEQINIATNNKLREYKNIWDKTLVDIDNTSRTQLDNIEKEWTSSVGSMTTKGIELITKFKTDWYGEIDATIQSTKTQLAELKKLTDAAASVALPQISASVDKSLNDKANTEHIGNNLVAGITSGINKATPSTLNAVEVLGQKLNNSMIGFWGIASPAKRTIETGMYIVMGLAKGLDKFSNVAIGSAEGIGVKAISALSSSMNTIPELFKDDVDLTLTPIVDLSKVQNGIDEVNTMFGSVSGLDLSTTMGLLPTSVKPTSVESTQSTTPDKLSKETIVNYNQYNYSPKALSRFDIYRQTKNQLSSMKGLVKA